MVRKVTEATAQIAAEDAAKTAEDAKEVFAGNIAAIDYVYTDPDGKPLGLIARLTKIMGSLPVLEPEGENKFFNYKFVKDKQVLGAVRPRLAQQKILVIPETIFEQEPIRMETAKGGHSLMTRIIVTWRIMDGINGESFTGQSDGYGDDGGDKGANKAFTAALKNFLLKLFLMGGEPDIEEDEETDKRAQSRETGSKRVDSVEIGDANITGVERGGKAAKATAAQLSRVGQYIRDLLMDAPAFAAFVTKKFEDHINLGDDPWVDVKDYLAGLSGKKIGELIAAFDDLLNKMEAEANSSSGGGYGD